LIQGYCKQSAWLYRLVGFIVFHGRAPDELIGAEFVYHTAKSGLDKTIEDLKNHEVKARFLVQRRFEQPQIQPAVVLVEAIVARIIDDANDNNPNSNDYNPNPEQSRTFKVCGIRCQCWGILLNILLVPLVGASVRKVSFIHRVQSTTNDNRVPPPFKILKPTLLKAVVVYRCQVGLRIEYTCPSSFGDYSSESCLIPSMPVSQVSLHSHKTEKTLRIYSGSSFFLQTNCSVIIEAVTSPALQNAV
jgi:hypothetical protein